MQDPEGFRGDISASMALPGDHWRGVGARFASMEDEQTGPVDVAAGKVEFPGGVVQFGLLDYGSDVTYLLTPASGVAKEEMATLALVALSEAGVMSIDDVLDESDPYEESTLAERIMLLEDWAGEAIAEVESTAVPVAVDVEVAGEPISSLERTFLRGGVLRGKGTRRIGTVKHFNVSRGGVIAPEGGGKEIDLPLTSVRSEGRDELKEGAKVTFRYGIRLSAKEAADVPANVEIEGA